MLWLVLAAAMSAQAPVLTEFRAFDGADEVTATTRFRVVRTGREQPAPVQTEAMVPLAPAIYDVQAIRTNEKGVVAIKSVERLAVMHYPDEAGRHLQVINFQPGHGALQLRTTDGRIDMYDVSLFPAGNRTSSTGRALSGTGYVLFVVPAGRYDVRVRHRDHRGTADTHWLLGIDVPADGTRLKVIDASD